MRSAIVIVMALVLAFMAVVQASSAETAAPSVTSGDIPICSCLEGKLKMTRQKNEAIARKVDSYPAN